MSNIIQASVTVKGARPLLWHHFTPEAMTSSNQRKERVGSAGNDPEEWRRTVLVTKQGQLYLEPSYVFATMRDAARYTKRGRGSIQSALAATLQVVDPAVLVDRFFPGFPNGHDFDISVTPHPGISPDQPVYLDVRSVRNPTTKGRNVRYRVAASPQWQTSFTLLWDKTVISRDEMEAVVRDAGQLVGLADGRSIGFGRFSLESFKVSES